MQGCAEAPAQLTGFASINSEDWKSEERRPDEAANLLVSTIFLSKRRAQIRRGACRHPDHHPFLSDLGQAAVEKSRLKEAGGDFVFCGLIIDGGGAGK